MRTRLEAAWYGNRNITNTAVPSIIILISMGCYLFNICSVNSRCNRAELIDTSHPAEDLRQESIYHFVSPQHLQRYATEFEYRFNNRKETGVDKFATDVTGTDNKRLKYKDLIK